MRKVIVLTALSVFLTGSLLSAQSAVDGDVKLFQGFFKDATVTSSFILDPGLNYQTNDYASIFDLGARGGFRLFNNFEMNFGLNFRTLSPDQGDSETGLSDIWLGGRYQFRNLFSAKTAFSVGGYITLPTGSEEIGQDLTHIGGFVAFRHAINKGFTLTGSTGIDFLDNGNDHDASLYLSVGSIFPVNPRLSIVPELAMMTDPDYMLLTGALDYKLRSKIRLRGGLGVGLDDGIFWINIKKRSKKKLVW